MTVKPQGERISALEQRIVDHESRCEERLAEIKKTAGDTQRTVEGMKNRFLGLALALAAWALAQVYATVSANAHPPTTQTVQVSSPK